MEIKCLAVPPIGTNCYLLMDEASKKTAIVDPGGGAKEIMAELTAMGALVEAIYLTHAHYDHTGAVEALCAAYPGTRVYLHPKEAATLGQDICPALAVELSYYEEGDVLSLGELEVKVMDSPGHTVGGVCLLVEDILVTGDSLFTGTMGRCDLPGGNYGQLIASLKRLCDLEGDYQVLPGHMETSTLDFERKTNPYMREAMGR